MKVLYKLPLFGISLIPNTVENRLAMQGIQLCTRKLPLGSKTAGTDESQTLKLFRSKALSFVVREVPNSLNELTPFFSPSLKQRGGSLEGQK